MIAGQDTYVSIRHPNFEVKMSNTYCFVSYTINITIATPLFKLIKQQNCSCFEQSVKALQDNLYGAWGCKILGSYLAVDNPIKEKSPGFKRGYFIWIDIFYNQ